MASNEEIARIRNDMDKMKIEIENLRSDLQKLRSERTDTNGPPTGSDEKKDANERSNKEEESKKQITYKDAFEIIGGKNALKKYEGTVATLRDEAGIQNSKLEEELKDMLPDDHTKRMSFSTTLINQVFVPSLDDLYDRARGVFASFRSHVEALAEKTNGEAMVAPLKGRGRAELKAQFKYRDASPSNGVAWYRLTDLVRATLVYKDIDTLYRGLTEVVSSYKDTNNRVMEINDRYQEELPGGYRDIQLVVSFEDHMCEVQLNTSPFIQAKKTTGHRDFEVQRELKAAIEEADNERVKKILDFGREHLGSTVGNSKEALRKLLQDEETRLLLHKAAKAGHAEILFSLLQAGADANAKDKNGDTPLHHAVFAGNERCVWVLINVGEADLTIKNDNGETSVVTAYMKLYQQPPEAAVRAVTTLLQVAGIDCVTEARERAKKAIREKLHVRRQLVSYAVDGNLEAMRKELCQYADPNSKDGSGQSALDVAIRNKNSKVVRLLLDFGASWESSEEKLENRIALMAKEDDDGWGLFLNALSIGTKYLNLEFNFKSDSEWEGLSGGRAAEFVAHLPATVSKLEIEGAEDRFGVGFIDAISEHVEKTTTLEELALVDTYVGEEEGGKAGLRLAEAVERNYTIKKLSLGYTYLMTKENLERWGAALNVNQYIETLVLYGPERYFFKKLNEITENRTWKLQIIIA